MSDRAPRLPPKLVALTPGTLVPGDAGARDALLERLRAASGAGLRGVLLREPGLFDRDLLGLLEALDEILGADSWIGVHDALGLCAAARVDGVQLGWRSLTPRAARRLVEDLARPPVLGFSAHADDRPGVREGADFLMLAPVFDSQSHPDPGSPDHRPPLGPGGLVDEVSRDSRPTWALGGLDARGVVGLLEDPRVRTGVAGVAVRGAILGSDGPREAARSTTALLAALEGLGGGTPR